MAATGLPDDAPSQLSLLTARAKRGARCCEHNVAPREARTPDLEVNSLTL